jgi:hypothetical protein
MWRVTILPLVIFFHNPEIYQDLEVPTLYEYGSIESSRIRADYDSPLISVWNGDGIQEDDELEEYLDQNVRILQKKGLLHGIYPDYD